MTRFLWIFALALLLTMSPGCSPGDGSKLQQKADAAEWKWSDYENHLLHCSLKGYEVRITRPKNVEGWEDNPFRIAIFDGEAEAYRFKGHEETVFTQIGDVVFVAELSPISSGCTVVAFDLKQRKELWRSHLKCNPPAVHSKYRHQVNITNDDGVVVVYGKESNGRYIEYIDARTGTSVGHKKLPPK